MPQNPQLQFEGFTSTAAGKASKFYQDAYVFKKSKTKKGKNVLLAAVADGCVPFRDGSHPSAIAIEMVTEFFASDIFLNLRSERDYPGLEKSIKELFNNININIYNRTQQENIQTRLSLSVVLVVEDTMFIGHIGTSGIFRVRDNELSSLSGGQSWISAAVKSKGLNVCEVRSASDILENKVMGVEPKVECDFRIDHLRPGDLILLCTDGVTEFISTQEMQVIIKSIENKRAVCNRFTEIAAERGLRDNATVVMFEVLSAEEVEKKSIEDIAEDQKGKGCGSIYSIFLIIILVMIAGGVYIGYRSARQIMYHLGEEPSIATPTPEESASAQELNNEGKPLLVLDKNCMPLNYLRINGKKKDPKDGKFQLNERGLNEIEVFPTFSKGTFNITITVEARPNYISYEGSTRNVIVINSDNIEVHLTKGAKCSFRPEGGGPGIAKVHFAGLGSPAIIDVMQENLILMVDKDP